MSNSMALNTIHSYKTGVRRFENFRALYSLDDCWPPLLEHLSMFIAYMSLQGLSHKSARLYMSGIAFQCKLKFKEDVTKHYVLNKLLEGMRRDSKKHLARLPITVDLLNSIIEKLPLVCTNEYESNLFSAAYSIAFFGFFRVGEITVSGQKWIDRVVGMHDIHLNMKEGHLIIRIRYSKTDQMGNGFIIRLNKSSTRICPVINTARFLGVRPSIPGPFLCHLNGKPLTRYQFTAVLKKAIGFDNPLLGHYKAHSFRIGAATTAAKLGHSADKIKEAGRWKSDAYKSYVQLGESSYLMPNLN